jgi:hypothetical protein
MKALSIAATVAALYASPVLAADSNKQLVKVHWETFCKPAEPKCAILVLSFFNYPHILPPVANLPLGLELIQKSGQQYPRRRD